MRHGNPSRVSGPAGFPTELWTAPRIGKVIAQRFGVEYSV
ncbi:MAG: winged helix-turn-helix domain-containing protein, partial [Nitrososphaerota archaeon]|nr:winged helix-turn-helix domain-containing protein [Nitrososphaerota archaeon]